MKDGVDTLNFRDVKGELFSAGVEAFTDAPGTPVLPEFVAVDTLAIRDCVIGFSLDSMLAGTNTGISLSLGERALNLFVRPRTDGWNEGVFILNFLFGSAGGDASVASPVAIVEALARFVLIVDDLDDAGWANAHPLFSYLQYP